MQRGGVSLMWARDAAQFDPQPIVRSSTFPDFKR